MPHIIAALFPDQALAQRALQALMESGVARDRIAIVGESEGREVSSISGFRELSAHDDVLGELHALALPAEDREVFEQGLRRGHVLMSARVDRSNMEEAMQVIDLFDPLDLDQHSEAWTREHAGQGGAQAGADVGAPLGAGLTAGMGTGSTNTSAVPGTGVMTDHTDDVGSADLRTREAGESGQTDLGLSSTTATGHRREEERAGRPGVMEIDPDSGRTAEAALAVKMAPGTGALSSGQGNAKPDLYRRETVRIGRVRAYSRD